MGRVYDENPLTCIHYRIEWRVKVNSQEVLLDIEGDVVLSPGIFWQGSLKRKLKKALRRKSMRYRRVSLEDTAVVPLTSDRTKHKFTNRFDEAGHQLYRHREVASLLVGFFPQVKGTHVNDQF